MQPFTDAQLQQLLADLESDRAERKESFRGKSPETVPLLMTWSDTVKRGLC